MMPGVSLSAARAIFMFLLHLTADMAGRTYDMLTALALAAAVLLSDQPLYIHYSGFLFSFGAVASIGLLLPALYKEKRPERKKRFGKLKQAAAAGGHAARTSDVLLSISMVFLSAESGSDSPYAYCDGRRSVLHVGWLLCACMG